MSNESLVAVPPDVSQPEVLKGFLLRLVEKLDEVLGFRGDNAAATTTQLEVTDTTLSAVASTVQDAVELLASTIEDVNANASDIEDNASAISAIESYWAHQELSSAYYDLDDTAWGSLVGNFEFAADGSLLTNTPYTASGGTVYRNFVLSVPTLNNGIVQRLVVINSSTTIQVFQRAGNTFSEAVTIGWLAL